MSLFGESPPSNSPFGKSSKTAGDLFGEESPTKASTSASATKQPDSSLFDSNNEWSLPTPKKQTRQSYVKSLLPARQVPDYYIDAYDILLSAKDSAGGVSLTAARKVLQSSGLTADDQQRILSIVVPVPEDSKSLERSEFNVLLALIGLAQEHEDLTLDGVDERRGRLPQPEIAYLEQLNQEQQNPTPTPIAATPTPVPQTPKQSKTRQESFGQDPWASPANKTPARMKPAAEEYVNGVQRTTSTFTTSGASQSSFPTDMSDAWGVPNGSNSGGFPDQSEIGGFEQPAPPVQQPNMSASIAVPKGTGELVTITTLPDKEGMFLFQHHNYEVKTIRRGSNVVRRYSDFVWLLDCLQKRYPFRRLPLLPPKRIQVNGNHLAADGLTFLDKRRKGLARFMNQVVEHPILSQETLVVMFLTVPTELSVWRKQATISVQEEFAGKALPHDLEDSLPSNLYDLFEEVRAGVRRGAEVYIGLCNLMDRLTKRNEAMAADNLKFSVALQSLTEGHSSTYAIDTNDVPLLNEGINATAKHLVSAQTLLEDEARAWDLGVLEDLKKIRDAMVSMKDMFDRRDRLARDNIPQLEKRISANENKLVALRQKPAGTVKAGEMEKIESSITNDKESIVQQHARGVFIKECVRDEIVTFQTTIFAQSHLHQDWAQERVKYAELQASNWRALVEETESMPVGE